MYISEAEEHIDVYKGNDNFATSGATFLSDQDLQKKYRAIDSVVTRRKPSYSVIQTKLLKDFQPIRML